MRQMAVMAALAVGMSVMSVAAQGRNFSGTWVVDAEKTAAAAPAGGGGGGAVISGGGGGRHEDDVTHAPGHALARVIAARVAAPARPAAPRGQAGRVHLRSWRNAA